MKLSFTVVGHIGRDIIQAVLLLCAAQSGELGVLMLLHLLAHIHCNLRSTKIVAEVVVQSRLKQQPRWLTLFTKQLYLLGCLLQKAVGQVNQVERRESFTSCYLTHSDVGVVTTNNRASLRPTAKNKAQKLWVSMRNHQMAFWFNNRWWKRTTTNPQHPKPSIKHIVFAAPHTTDPNTFPEHPTCSIVVAGLDACAH